ncbi:MAG: hypothetical protein IJX37_08195 [Oscillospiraceae bacterium]|nr:hypothetical protein [Oscillospiraceae bacterium]
MDDIIEAAIELFGDLMEAALKNIKNPRKRKWALTVFYSVLGLGVTAVPTYFAIRFGMENNTTGAIVVGVLAVVMFFVFGFLIIRGHRQNWKSH